MGFNIAGLVIRNNYNSDLNEFANDVQLKLEIVEEINYETASANWTPEGEFRLYFSDSATLIFFNHEEAFESYHSRAYDSLSFSYSAIGMVFSIEYFENGNLVRSIDEVEGKRKSEFGKFLNLEKENPTADGLIFELINSIIGEPFTKIDGASRAYKCKKMSK